MKLNGTINLSSGNTFQIDGTTVLSNNTLGSGVTSSSLTSVGTLTAGTWQATTIGTQYGGTGKSITGTSIANGQLLIGNTQTDGFDLATLTEGSGITITNGDGTITISQTGTGSSKWAQDNENGVLYPNISTLDLLIGGTATNSAKFGFLNVAGGTPTASISANSGNNAIFLDGAGNIGTTNKQTLTVGSASTGDINLTIGAGNNLRVNGTNIGQTLSNASCINTINGIITGTGTCAATDNFWDQSAGLLFAGNTTVDLAIGGNSTASAKFAVLNVAGGTPTASISANSGNNATTLSGLGVLGTTNMQTLTLGSSSTGNIVIDAGSGLITLSDPVTAASTLTTTGTLTANGTLDANGVITLGDGGDSFTLDSSDIDISGGAITGATGLSSSGTVTFSGLTAGGFVKAGAGTGTLSVASTINLASEVSGILSIDNGGSPFEQADGAIFERIGTQDFLLGGTATASAKFAVLNIAGGTPIASISATSTGTGVVIAGDGSIQSLRKGTLTLGGGTTGNIVIDAGSGVVQLADLTTNGVLYTSGGNGKLNSEAQLNYARGGTGYGSYSAGQLLIGKSDGSLSRTTLTQGSGITITNGDGTITIS
ncbi:MAG TPA: hypothetical protein V6C65_35045, partial [Allocoleopsis sp.]